MCRELDSGTLQWPTVVEITVCGYPRSGNCWIARLLGEALDVKVVGIKGGRDSVAAEGLDRPGDGYVKQAHLWPGHGGGLRVDLENKDDHIFLHIVRDPRDIAVSAAHYWDWSLDKALDKMIEGPGPLDLPSWATYVRAWMAYRIPILRYEDFHEDTKWELTKVLNHLGLEPQKDLAAVVENQSFPVKRAELERRGNRYPFKRTAQLKHIRSGKVGEWGKELSIPQKQRAFAAWRRLLHRLGYYQEALYVGERPD